MTSQKASKLGIATTCLAVSVAALGMRTGAAQEGQASASPKEASVTTVSIRRAPAGEGRSPDRPMDLVIEPGRAPTCPTPEELQQKWTKSLDQVRAEARPVEGVMPIDCSANLFANAESSGRFHRWGCSNFQWAATEFASQPAYFDDVPLERYGQTVCPLLQPLVSGVRFYGTVAVMPYKLVVNGPFEPVYTSGYYRPGSDAPCIRQRLP